MRYLVNEAGSNIPAATGRGVSLLGGTHTVETVITGNITDLAYMLNGVVSYLVVGDVTNYTIDPTVLGGGGVYSNFIFTTKAGGFTVEERTALEASPETFLYMNGSILTSDILTSTNDILAWLPCLEEDNLLFDMIEKESGLVEGAESVLGGEFTTEEDLIANWDGYDENWTWNSNGTVTTASDGGISQEVTYAGGRDKNYKLVVEFSQDPPIDILITFNGSSSNVTTASPFETVFSNSNDDSKYTAIMRSSGAPVTFDRISIKEQIDSVVGFQDYEILGYTAACRADALVQSNSIQSMSWLFKDVGRPDGLATTYSNPPSTILMQVKDKTIVKPIITLGSGETRYLDASAIGLNNGLTETDAWTDIESINGLDLAVVGSNILFKRGEVFNITDTVYFNTGGDDANRTLYGAYGDPALPMPVINADADFDYVWTESVEVYGEKSWTTTLAPELDLKRLKRDGVEILRANATFELGALDGTFKWYFNEVTGSLTVWGNEDPNLSTFRHWISRIDVTYADAYFMTFNNLAYEGGNQQLRALGKTDIRIVDCEIGNMAVQKGVNFSGGCHRILVEYNDFDSHLNIDYTHVSDPTGAYTSPRGAEDCLAYNDGDDFITRYNSYENWCHASIIHYGSATNSKVYYNYSTSSKLGYGGRITSDDSNSYIEMYNNLFYDNAAPSQIVGQHNHIHHNVFLKQRNSGLSDKETGQGFSMYGDTGTALFENNIFAECEGSGLFLGISGSVHIPYENTFRNNIFYNVGLLDSWDHQNVGVRAENLANVTENIYNNNIWYNDSGIVIFDYKNTIYNSVAEFDAATLVGGDTSFDNLQLDPLISDIEKFIFTVNEGSPAIGAGVVPTAAEDYYGETIVNNNIGVSDAPGLLLKSAMNIELTTQQQPSIAVPTTAYSVLELIDGSEHIYTDDKLGDRHYYIDGIEQAIPLELVGTIYVGQIANVQEGLVSLHEAYSGILAL